MADQNSQSTNDTSKVVEVNKTVFGVLKPLTAAQVISLLIHSDITLGSTGNSTGPCACGGPCY